MNIERIRYGGTEIIEYPNTLYKYRECDNEYHLTILSEQVVFMAPPSSFEDQLDCKSMKRYDLMTEQDIYNHYLSHSKEMHADWSRQKHRAFARDWTKKSPMKNKEQIKKMQEDHFNDYDKRFGVLSLTENILNQKMWTKYSAQGTGFSVGFSPQILFEYIGGGGKVTYYDELPIIYHDDSFELERVKQIFSKERNWEFEQEYRTTKFYPQNSYPEGASTNDRKISVPKDGFSELVFGINTSDECKDALIRICEEQELRVSLKQIINEDQQLKLIDY